RLGAARAQVDAAAEAAGRDPAAIDVHLQIWVTMGTDRSAAEAKLRRSQHFRRTVALHPQRSEVAAMSRYVAGNLIGSPDEVAEQLRPYEVAGVEHLGLVFIGNDLTELLEDIERFASEVIPR